MQHIDIILMSDNNRRVMVSDGDEIISITYVTEDEWEELRMKVDLQYDVKRRSQCLNLLTAMTIALESH